MPTIPNKLFIDTNVFVALYDENDSTSKKAHALLDIIEKEKITLYTSSDVIGETLTVISKKLGKTAAKVFLEVYKKSTINELFVDEMVHIKTCEFFLSVPSKNISFIDCSNVIVMKQHKIETIFSFDSDFKKLGVSLLK